MNKCMPVYIAAFCVLLCSCASASPKPSERVFPDSTLEPIHYSADRAAAPPADHHMPADKQPPASHNVPVPQAPLSAAVPEESKAQAAPIPDPKAAPIPIPKAYTKPKPLSKETAPVKPAKEVSQSHQLTLAQLVKKYPELLRLRGSSRSNNVALTFDDAPDETYTPQVLDILKKYQVRATFFLLGAQAVKHPDIVKRIAREGHIIGNHSYNHKLFTKLSDDMFRAQVQDTQRTLKKLIGYAPKLMRPPYGEISESQLLWASDSGFTIVNWNVDSVDWKQLDAAHVSSNILSHTHPGSIVLQHSGGGPGQNLSGTVQALPTVISTLKSRGYKLVTLPELLRVSKEM